MKTINKILLINGLFLLTLIPSSYAQLQQKIIIHFHIDNHDLSTRAQLSQYLSATTPRAATNTYMLVQLNNLIQKEKELIKKKYGKTTHDKQFGALGQLVSPLVLELGKKKILTTPDAKYMPLNKRDHITDLGLDMSVIASILALNNDKITAANRQEIYRLRKEIIKGYSQRSKKALGLSLLTAIRDPALTKVFKKVSFIE